MPLSLQIVLGMASGAVVGMALGPKAVALGELGRIAIQLIKAAAAPLLFFYIVHAILTSEVKAKDGLRMALIAAINASIALTIGLGLSNFFKPGRHLHLQGLSVPAAVGYSGGQAQRLDVIKTISGFIPTSIVQPFAENMVITLVFLAILFGAGLRRVKTEQVARGESGYKALEDGVRSMLRILEVIVGWIIRLAPLAVFGVVAKSVGEYGFAPVRGLAAYLAVGLLGLALHAAVAYQIWLVFYARVKLSWFWNNAKEALIYAVGANSSLATLPLTLKSLDRMGVSRASSTLGACVGTNLNHDGIILYEAMAMLFVAQAYGLKLTLMQQCFAALSCLIAAVGIAGVPEAGFVSLSLVLATVGLPTEILPLLLTVDWIIARGRTVVNVLSDMLVLIILECWKQRGTLFALSPRLPTP